MTPITDRHEYSPPVEPQSKAIPRRSPLARAAFSTPLITRSSPAPDRPGPNIRRERPLSDSKLHEHTVRFQGFESDTMDEEDGRSTTSDGSNTTGRASRYKRRSSKPSSNYHFAYPAPTKLQTQRLLQIRPKLLLQLQHLPPGGHRPMPAIDVLPSTVLASRVLKKFPRMFRGKGELGANDLMIVKSETYNTDKDEEHGEIESDEEGYSNRELLAVVCQARKDFGGSVGRAEIVMADGTVWTATPQQNGSFEFVTVNEEGRQTTARWVKRAKRHSADLSEATEHANDHQFNFSIIDPTMRRHPIIATMISTKLTIPDSYTPVSSSSGTFPPSPINAPVVKGTALPPIAVDERLKLLIQATCIWVALRKGWCPYFKYNDIMASPNSATRPRAVSNASRSLPVSLCPSSGPASPALRPELPDSNHSTFSVVGDKIRRSCALGSAPPSPLDKPAPPLRSVSTGSAFVQKQTAARRGQYPSVVASGSEADSILALKRAEIDMLGSLSTPLANGINLSSSYTTIPETPTKPSPRPHSTLIPSSAAHNGKSRERPHSEDNQARTELPEATKKQKIASKPQRMSRWKSFSNFFKRGSKKSDFP